MSKYDKLLGFRTTEDIINKIKVRSVFANSDKQDILNEMVNEYFKKHPLTVEELKLLRRQTK